MPMLLQDLAEETARSNRWVTERLDAEARSLEAQLRNETAQTYPPAAGYEVNRVTTDVALSVVDRIEGFWKSTLVVLRKDPNADGAVNLLQSILRSVESGLNLILALRRVLPMIAKGLRTQPEWLNPLDELDQPEKRLLELAAEVKKALHHRTSPWQPSDPDRLAKGLQLAREGKTISADEARARFNRTHE